MKIAKKLLTLSIALVLGATSLSMVGCGKKNTGKTNQLRVTFFEGGFGRKWLENALNDFVAKKKNEGTDISYVLEGKPDSITTEVKTYLGSGKNLSDIYMTQNAEWQGFVTNGNKLASLESVYETEVEKLDGSKVKVKDLLLPEVVKKGYMRRKAGQGKEQPWILPWSLLETSIIYNEDLMKKTPKSTGGFWTETPKTMQELAALCNDINAANASKVYGGEVVPFSWTYGNINYFEYVLNVLWAQQQGVYESRIDGEGAYYDFWNFESPDVWKQTGIQKAIDEWANIIVDKSTGKWKNSFDENFVSQKTFMEAALSFCQGKSVLFLGGSFFENEMGMYGYLDQNNDGKADFNYKMMYVPLSADALKNEDGTDSMINYCSVNDMMFVPAEATNVELAKEFLAFMCNEKYLLDFTLQTGCLRPFDYDPVELTKNDGNVKWSDFFLSCYDMKKNADYNLFNFPMNAAKTDSVSLYYTTYTPVLFQSPGVAQCMRNMRTQTGKQIMVDGVNGDGKGSVYAESKKVWDDWTIALGQ